ncbi:MAG TPA: cupin domain-containing protein [Mycobacteriales bacterium]|nr:cupin domain-containing protein [Mycobacteriales bacterium]
MTESQQVAALVARTVKSVRSAHGMTPESLAARAGMETDTLLALEAGTELPSLQTLIQVSDALLIPLSRLVEGEPQPTVRLVPPDRQPVLWHGPHGGTGQLIVGSDPKPALELWKWRLEPGETRHGTPHLPGDREVTYVDEGELTLTLDGHRFTLPAGHAAIFVGDRPHSYGNETDRPLLYTVTLSDP